MRSRVIVTERSVLSGGRPLAFLLKSETSLRAISLEEKNTLRGRGPLSLVLPSLIDLRFAGNSGKYGPIASDIFEVSSEILSSIMEEGDSLIPRIMTFREHRSRSEISLRMIVTVPAEEIGRQLFADSRS